MRSLRFRLTAVAALVMFVTAAVLSFVLLNVMRDALVDEIDTSVKNQAIDYASNVFTLDDLQFERLPLDFGTVLMVIDADGTALVSTDPNIDPSEITSALDLDSVGFGEATVASLSLQPTEFTDGEEDMRAAFTQLDVGDVGQSPWVVVARTLTTTDRTIATLQRALMAAVPALAALVAALTWWLTGRALAPVERMRRDVDQINATSLQQRVSHPGANDEISRLGDTMNGMLDRLERSHVQQERFVSDAAHELRTPLASMAAQLDVDALHPETADPAATGTRLRSEVSRLQDLVESLLALARTNRELAPAANSAGAAGAANATDVSAEAAGTVEKRAPVDLDDLVTVSAHRIRCPEHLDLTVHAASGLVASANEQSLERALDNLVANAFRHAHSRVDVRIDDVAQNGQARIIVDDDGDGIAPADAERIFDRFVRLDEARNRDAGGTGLGLALARDIAHAHGGTLTTTASPLGGARFVLRVPVSA